MDINKKTIVIITALAIVVIAGLVIYSKYQSRQIKYDYQEDINRDSPFGLMDPFHLRSELMDVIDHSLRQDYKVKYMEWADAHVQNIGVKWSKVADKAIAWGIIEPELGNGYNWSNLDEALKYVFQNSGQNFIGVIVPNKPERGLVDFTDPSIQKHFRNFVKALVERYDGDSDFGDTGDVTPDPSIRIKHWQADNEPFNAWFVASGGTVETYVTFLELLSEAAKEADPEAILIWNDYSNEDRIDPVRKRISDLTYNKIKELKSKGVPIDGVGMQMHLRGLAQKDPTKSDVIENMKRFGELGLKIYITEFDVRLDDLQRMPQKERWDYQAQIYKDMLEACLESGVCESFSIFGLSDTRSWYDSEGIKNTEPLPFDKNYNPKPAYYAIQDTLLQCE